MNPVGTAIFHRRDIFALSGKLADGNENMIEEVRAGSNRFPALMPFPPLKIRITDESPIHAPFGETAAGPSLFGRGQQRHDAVADPGERLQLVDHRNPQILMIAGGVFQRLGQFVDVG